MIYFYSSNKQLYITMMIWLFFQRLFQTWLGVLKKEAGIALNWLKQIQMIANSVKFHVILITEDQTNTSIENLDIKGELVKSEEAVKLLQIHQEYKLSFGKHFSEICRNARWQVNVLERIKRLDVFDEKKMLVPCFIYSNFDSCPLVWYFSSDWNL